MDPYRSMFVIPDWLSHPYSHYALEQNREMLLEQLRQGTEAARLQKEWQSEIEELRSREDREIIPKIPRLYRRTDPQLMPDPQAHAAVLRWSSRIEKEPDRFIGNPRGLICYGPTGSGKTRAVYDLLAHQCLVENGDFCFCAISASELAGFVRDLALSNPRRLARILRLLAGRETDEDFSRETDPDVIRFYGLNALFIDDLSQAKFTPRYAEELLSIIEARAADGSPLFVTCQMTGDRLLTKLAGDNPDLRETAEAIIRRLRDFCDPIGFTLPATSLNATRHDGPFSSFQR
jgi:DNA replication protein DnaC